MQKMKLTVNEIFYSIQGETTSAGFPSLFIRLTGCNLRCRYCDTRHAWNEGEILSIDEILKKVTRYACFDHITVTGGEPLLQENSIHLMKMLIDTEYKIQVETNGSMILSDVPKDIRKIIDVKTPSSGETESFLLKNLDLLTPEDEIKFVISDMADYNYSRKFIENYLQKKDLTINFSPVFGKISFTELAELILNDRLRVRLNIQLHKIIWPEGEPGKPLIKEK